MWCGVVWCGEIWCGVVRCGVVLCGVARCGVVLCGVVWCGVVRCGVVWCGEVWCSEVWCDVVWCGVDGLSCEYDDGIGSPLTPVFHTPTTATADTFPLPALRCRLASKQTPTSTPSPPPTLPEFDTNPATARTLIKNI